jgi:hypothetical protein
VTLIAMMTKPTAPSPTIVNKTLNDEYHVRGSWLSAFFRRLPNGPGRLNFLEFAGWSALAFFPAPVQQRKVTGHKRCEYEVGGDQF